MFLPIDIDLTGFTFSQLDDTDKMVGKWQPFWDTSKINYHTAKENNLARVLDQLPLERVTILTYKTQLRDVGRHVDVYPEMNFEEGEFENIKANEPAGYRIVLQGQDDRLLVNNGEEWVQTKLPSVPCCYLLNSTEGEHKVLDDADRRIIYIRGFLNPERHRTLIERSYNKYKDYAVIAK